MRRAARKKTRRVLSEKKGIRSRCKEEVEEEEAVGEEEEHEAYLAGNLEDGDRKLGLKWTVGDDRDAPK